MKNRLLQLSIAVFSLTVFVPVPSSGSNQLPRLRAYIERNAFSLLTEYLTLLSIPNIASDADNIRRNADAILSLLRRRGIEAGLLEGEGCPPLVYGEILNPAARRTVLFYAHYDGQPVDASQWTDDPWHPVLRDGRLEDGGRTIDVSRIRFDDGRDYRLYGRSTSDDKAPIIALAAALDYLKTEKSPLSFNLKMLFEGEEEAGSPHLPMLLQKYRDMLKVDAVFICDGPVDQSGRMQVVFGVRGSIGLELTAYGPNHALHSGHYGNWAPNPIALLVNLLGSMRDDEGRVLVDRFNDGVRPITEREKEAIRAIPDIDAKLRQEYGLAWTEAGNARLAERILLPALNFRGLGSGGVGKQAANAVPPEASASIDIRLVPDQDPENVKRAVEEHIKKKGFHMVGQDPTREERLRYPRLIKVQWDKGYPPYRLPLDDPLGQAVIKALAGTFSEPPLSLPSLGGSAPLWMFADSLGVPVLGLPIANYDNNQHGPNENIRLKNLWDGIAMFAVLLSGLGTVW